MTNPTLSNPIAAMVSSMRNGNNPMALIQHMAESNPQMKQFMQMVRGKSSAQLKQMAENMAKERGVSINDVARQLGITLPSDK